MPRRPHKGLALVLGGLLIAIPTASEAQRHGGRSHGGGWHGGGGHGGGWHGGGRHGYGGRYAYGGNTVYYGHRGYGAYPVYGYGGYAGYPGYYRYGGYYGYHHHDNDGVWIALGAGLLGVIIGSALARPPVYQYPYPSEAPPPQASPPPAPVTPRCQDGSPVPVGGYCTGPAEPSPPPPKAERG